ncbi:tetratricopeptide repeat protein [Pontibacter sp. CAU 1760]
MVQVFRVLLLAVPVLFASCNLNEGGSEKMVNLQQVKDDPDAQLSNLTDAIAQSGRDGSLYARRAVVLLRKGEMELALEDANKAIALNPHEPYSLFVKAQVLRRMGKPNEALPLALQADNNSYVSPSLYVLLGDLYLQRQDYQQARVYLAKAQELAPKDEFAFYYTGRLAEASGDTAKALKNYRLALQQAPAFVESQRELGGLLVMQQQYDEARPYIKSALKQAPQDGKLWFYKGLLQKAAQQVDSAQLAFKKAVALDEELVGAHYWLGLQEHALGNNAEALQHLEKVAAQYRSQPKYLSTVASAYERIGQYGKSLAAYQRLVEAAPNYTYAYQAISRIKYKIAKPMPDSTSVQPAQTE